jgi:hypothetical protein
MTAEGELPDHVDRMVSKPPKLKDLREALADCYALISNSWWPQRPTVPHVAYAALRAEPSGARPLLLF